MVRWRGMIGLIVAAGTVVGLRADGPLDNLPDKVRPIPPAGIKIAEEDRATLQKSLREFGDQIAKLREQVKGKASLASLLPDVEIFHKAVYYALEYNEFFAPAEVKQARELLEQGMLRARQLRRGNPAWTQHTGLIVRGYRSRIDGSVQPYGLVIPSSYRPDGPRHRLDIWLHGRGEKLSELNFLVQRQRDMGLFTPAGAFVLHPYGRYCNAFKFAGEVDVLEAMEHVQQQYPIDEDRVVMRGFSMGGAGCWQMAAHYPGKWAAAAPGAGFSETPEFLRLFQSEKLSPSPIEKTLWRMYDCPDWAANFFNLPLVVYSGEKDKQKQAADIMVPALAAEKIDMVHIIGPGTGHSYHPRAKVEIDRRIDRIVARGRDRVPSRVRFTTYTLRYDRSHWVRLDALEQHWKKALIDAQFSADGKTIEVQTSNVKAFTLAFGPGDCPLPFASTLMAGGPLLVNGQKLQVPRMKSDRSWSASYHLGEKGWQAGRLPSSGLYKRPGLQGPIDDAFLDSFVMVRPTGKAPTTRVDQWVQGEMKHAIEHWRKQFRGDARIKDDKDINEADLAQHNLILWGDPSSNIVLKKILPALPITWDARIVKLVGAHDATHHVPVLIYPNPLNPKRYVVVNSGFTYREYDYLNNARQVPKLPDHAILDVTTPPSSRWPGKIVEQGFFTDAWRISSAVRGN